MKEPAARHVENDISPERERLDAAEAEAILARCTSEFERGLAKLIDASPPVSPRGRPRFGRNDPTLYIGLLGQAFGLLHIHERTGRAEHLELALRYLVVAREAIDRSGFPPPHEWLSFHATGGVSAVAAVIYDRLGDTATSERHLADYLRLAEPAADPHYPTDDLLWGRGGFLYGAAFLRARLGRASVPDKAVAAAIAATIESGRRQAREHASELTPGPHGTPPLLYVNLNRALIGYFARAVVGWRSALGRAVASAGATAAFWRGSRLAGRHFYDLSLVHGLPGNLYLAMHFPELLARDSTWLADVRASLDCVADCVDAERGILALLPSPRSDALIARTRSERYTNRVHWCAGSPAAVFVFSRAYQVFGDEAYLDVARRAADHTWRYGLLRKGNGICHGIAGNGYAFLALHRAASDGPSLDRALHFARHSLSERITSQQRTPDRPWSLYEGTLGTLCFYLDCLDPDRARFPAFEV